MNYAEPASLLEEIQALRENCDAMGILKRTKEFLYRPLKIVFEPFESTRTFYTHLSKLETIWQKLFWLVSKDD